MTAGDVLIIKTTGERVCVTDAPDANGTVPVRRPMASSSGITHTIENFNSFELCEEVEYMLREQELFEAVQKKRKSRLESEAAQTVLIN